MAKRTGHRGVGVDHNAALVECSRCGRRARPEQLADDGGDGWTCRPRAAEACTERVVAAEQRRWDAWKARDQKGR